MRFFQAAGAALSAATLLTTAQANDAQSILNDAKSAGKSVASDASSVVESATSGPELPTFTPTKLKADFIEQFTDDWLERWQPSHAKKDTSKSDKKDEEWAYVGEWAVEEPHVYKGMEGDKGLVVKNPAAHHAISAKFPKKVENKGKTLVVQYETKLQNGLECGGAYLKLLRDNKALHQEEFSNVSPYVIMFGPDKCGSTNKVHLIINHKNPKTGEYEEKHLNSAPAARITKTSELYTVIIHPNNTVILKIGGKQVKEANLLEDFTPAFNPPTEIDDEKDSKPEDWVNEAQISDPEATKPEEWDEDAPFEIVDDDATMPEDWLESEPLTVPDPEAQMPEDWDPEEDGDWIAPSVPNSKCDDISGCGKWEKPMIKNPAYKGKWIAPLIDNPEYKGIWTPRKIKNPNYFEDKHPANLEPMGAIGFEIWTMQSDILFDNIYIGHSVEDAEKFARETFDKKVAVELALENIEKPKQKEPLTTDIIFTEDPIGYIKEKLDLFISIAKEDPVQAIKAVPEIAGGLIAIVVTAIAIVASILGFGGAEVKVSPETKDKVKKTAAKAKESAVDATEKVKEAVASGADTVKSEVNKRATRSSS